MATITFENVSKKFGSNEVLKNLSLVVQDVGKLSYYACLQDLMCQIVAVF